MSASRGLAVLLLLLVVGSGAAMVAEFTFGLKLTDETPSLGTLGFIVLTTSIMWLTNIASQRRAQFTGVVGLFIGFALIIVVDALLRVGAVAVYTGIAVLVATGIVLSTTLLVRNRQQRPESS